MLSKSDLSAFSDARATARDHGVLRLLSRPDSNPKVAKNAKVGVFTLPLHLAPARLSGFEVCPARSAGCTAACLHTAGNRAHMPQKTKSRIARTRFYFAEREAYMTMLAAEIAAHVRRAARYELAPAIRLNATSDVPYERVPVTLPSGTLPNIMAAYPAVTFYDYTKRSNRKEKLPRNYFLTFSLAENNDAAAIAALRDGLNVAVVFNTKRSQKLPNRWRLGEFNLPVTDGDLHDYRPIDPRLSFVGLRAKGDAIGDASGFVRDVKE